MTARGRRTWLRALAVVTAGMVLSVTGQAASASSTQGQLVISDTTPSPGDESGTVIQGTEYAAGAAVDVLFNGQPFEQATADSGGTFVVEFFPEPDQCGQAIDVAATGEGSDGGSLRKTGSLTVTCEAAQTSQPPPPRDYDTGVCATAEAGRFSDVPHSSASASAIDCLVSLGIVHGYADGTYRPDHVVDRASVAVYLARTAEHLTHAGVFDDTTPPPFRDLDGVTDEQRASIQGLHHHGVVQGVRDDAYAPAQRVSRAQAASLVQRLNALVQDQSPHGRPADLPAGEDYYSDDDTDVHEPAINAVSAGGVLQGTGPGTFAPARGLDRGQLALYLARYLQFVSDTRA